MRIRPVTGVSGDLEAPYLRMREAYGTSCVADRMLALLAQLRKTLPGGVIWGFDDDLDLYLCRSRDVKSWFISFHHRCDTYSFTCPLDQREEPWLWIEGQVDSLTQAAEMVVRALEGRCSLSWDERQGKDK